MQHEDHDGTDCPGVQEGELPPQKNGVGNQRPQVRSGDCIAPAIERAKVISEPRVEGLPGGDKEGEGENTSEPVHWATSSEADGSNNDDGCDSSLDGSSSGGQLGRSFGSHIDVLEARKKTFGLYDGSGVDVLQARKDGHSVPVGTKTSREQRRLSDSKLDTLRNIKASDFYDCCNEYKAAGHLKNCDGTKGGFSSLTSQSQIRF